MGTQIKCFWVDRVPKIRRRLRRFSRDRDCSVQAPNFCSCCDASVPMDVIDWSAEIIEHFEPDKDDPRWPTACDRCHEQFRPDDYWQIFCDWIYKISETGEEVNFRDLPPGAMFNCHWSQQTGPGGIACTVRLPCGANWNIDGSAYDHGKTTPNAWTRTGTPPNISASPSILTSGYHGVLTNGVLNEC